MYFKKLIEFYSNYEISTTGMLYIALAIAAVCLAIGFKIYAIVKDKKEKQQK
ncbi:MAG: hypothetical protein PUB09_01310 [Firmicutes bacterium]|nr:hypothetical protein [Bacillota bacterium]